MLVCPKNAAFFCGALADLQEMLPGQKVPLDFAPQAILYIAPPFRHTHFQGKQVVVHNRHKDLHEIFAYNLYPGPSAKKGAYGVLIHQGEQEGWLTAHASTVQVVTPYDNVVTILHEGASGGGKSEMLEPVHREPDGLVLLGRNLVTGERRTLSLPRTCELRPVSDDMALCHPSLQGAGGRLVVMDAENAWFLRLNHIDALRHRSVLGRPVLSSGRAAVDAEHGRQAGSDRLDLGAHRGCTGQAVPESAGDHAAAAGAERGRRSCVGGHPQLRHPHPAQHA